MRPLNLAPASNFGFCAPSAKTRRLRDLHFDALIALTVRAHGARLITSNRADFELIQTYRGFALEVW